LFVKGDYSFDSVQFVFETNTAIAAKYGDNEAELLKEWFDNQDNLDSSLLKRCTEKINSIVIEYINEQFPKVEKENKSDAQSALIDFNNLPASVWEDFTKAIKFIFCDISSDSAIEKVTNSVNNLIRELPFPTLENKIDNVFTTLYYEVSVKMFQNEPEKRCLTNQILDALILELGDESDKQYKIAFEAWKETKKINYFNLAEFFEVVHSAKYCRQSIYLKEYTSFWLNLLHEFIQFAETPDRYKKRAIYEFLWLSLRPLWLKKPDGSLKGLDSLIEKYFSTVGNSDDYEAIENDFNLIQIVRASILMSECDLPFEKTNVWLNAIGSIINSKAISVENPNEKCCWLELHSLYLSNPLVLKKEVSKPEEVFQCYKNIIELLPQAPLYNVTRLCDRINQFITIYIETGNQGELIDSLEELADKLMPYVSAKNGNHILAKTNVDRGVKYLNTSNPLHLAKTLNYFHKAKDLWLQEETAEGYVFGLLNISQLYSALNMNLAAKYYALSAAWFSINNNPEKLASRIASAFGMMVYCDYKQGSWISAIDNFEYYISARVEFDKRPLDEKDEMLMKIFVNVAGILSMAPRVSTQLTGYIEFQKQKMGNLFKDFIEPLVFEYERTFEKIKFESHLQDKLDASPINDIGSTRTIEWKAFGSVWLVSFPNNWIYNSLGEEFVATLQILLVELSSSSTDLHFIRTKVEIEIEESAVVKQPEQLASNHSFKWKIYSKKIDEADRDKIRMQMASLILGMKFLLRDLSMIEDDKFFQIVDKLFQNEALAEKTMTNNLYQRIYRGLFTEKSFDASMRSAFQNETLTINLREDKILEWNNSPSPIYSKEKSMGYIEGRYKNTVKVTYLTIEHLKKQPGYKEWLANLRARKFLDWQILLALFNHILTFKANRKLDGRTFTSDEIGQAEYQKAFHSLKSMDEKDCFVEFPLEYFTEKEFDFQLDQTAFLVLRTWGLQNLASFPNFAAIKDFLIYRFNYGVDEIPELSPFN
jgi:hypothetical protein